MIELETPEQQIENLQLELNAIRARLKEVHAERLQLWPKAQLADTYLSLLRRARDTLQKHRKSMAGVQLRAVDLLLTDIARAVRLVDTVEESVAIENQPCFACGATQGATQAPEGRFKRCNACGYAG